MQLCNYATMQLWALKVTRFSCGNGALHIIANSCFTSIFLYDQLKIKIVDANKWSRHIRARIYLDWKLDFLGVMNIYKPKQANIK
jgi:hypothetical protein